MALLAAMSLLTSCSHQPPVEPPQADQRSVRDRVAELDNLLSARKRPMTEQEISRDREAQLREIQRLGLVERAERDFRDHLTNAVITSWSIGFFIDTNMVWCDVRYSAPGSDSTCQKEFGYTMKTGTNWSLLWED